MSERIVIAGAGLAGLRAAERLRELGFDGEVVVLGAEPDIAYHRPALFGQELELTTTVVGMRGARATRASRIALAEGGALLAEISTEWVWVRASDMRPTRIPAEALAAFSTDD